MLGFVSALPGGLWMPLMVSVVLGATGIVCSKTRARKIVGAIISLLALGLAVHDWMLANS